MAPKYYFKAIDQFRAIKNLSKKLKGTLQAGSRIAPSRTAKNDAAFQLRLDAGELIGTKLNVYLQVNKEAKSTLFQDWLKKYGSHSNLAEAVFDTAAEDEEAEKERVIDELAEKGSEALSNL